MHNWTMFDGWAVKQGVDPMELPVDRFFNLVYFWLVDGADQDEIAKFDAKLWIPPVGTKHMPKKAVGPWAPDAETAALGDLAAALGSAR